MPSDDQSGDGTSRWSNPFRESKGLVGKGAVLYDVREPDRRPCCSNGGRCLAHVVGVYQETTHGEVYFRVQDGTHSTEHWCHQGDLLALYEPAGWSLRTGVKPTYALTRIHGVEDHHDLMADGGQSTDDRPQHHEFPTGGLEVVREFRGEVRHSVMVAPDDRDLYELLIDILDDSGERVRGTFAANVATEFDTLPAAERGLRDIDRGGTGVGDRWYGMSITLGAARAIAEYRDREPLKLAAVGCSGSKYEDVEPIPAKERYKGSYWSNKRGYGETCDDYRAISAEHDVLHPEAPIAYYERTPDDWRGIPVHSEARLPSGDPVNTRLDLWALAVYEGLSAWIMDVTDGVDPRDVELEVLLGRPYRDPLEERGVFEALRAPGELTVSFPFQDIEQAQGGMIEQIGWMSDEIAAAEVATDGGEARVE